MKKVSVGFILLLLSVLLFGCAQKNQEKEPNHGHTTKEIPKEMPDDFNFSVAFGVDKENEINTFDGTITKDLIADGTITTAFTFTEEELNAIYNKMHQANITEKKEFIPKPIRGTVCEKRPHEEDQWKITINGETFTHFISGKYCDPTADARQLLELRTYIFDMVKNKEVYQSLPEKSGGYE